MYAGKAQWVLCQIWGLRQIEVALKYGVDVSTKNARVSQSARNAPSSSSPSETMAGSLSLFFSVIRNGIDR
jgi:hypothetical protein